MGAKTDIAWTDATWNCHQGCRKVNEDCKHCYMERDKKRYGQDPLDVHRSADVTFRLPLKLKAPQRVFVCSWSDFFIEEADAWRSEAWDIIRRCPHLTFQIPTKRPERILSCLPPDWGAGWDHVHLGVSAGHQKSWDTFVPILQAVPAALRWVSIEPQTEEIRPTAATLKGIGWIVIGGESGGMEARPFNPEWARLLNACAWAVGARVFVKQMGSAWARANSADKRGAGANPSEWPADLRIREFPEVPHG